MDSSRGRFAETVHLKSADATAHVTIELLPLADVEGRILGEEGEPMAGVAVYTGAELRSTSDAEGRYRLENLVPASYQSPCACPMKPGARPRSAIRKPAKRTGTPDTQYYPGQYEETAAVPVPIAPGMHLRKFDIRLRRTRLVALGGRIVETAGGGPIADAEVELAGSARRRVDPQGAFRFDLVRPGHYTLAGLSGQRRDACLTSCRWMSAMAESRIWRSPFRRSRKFKVR